MAPCMRPTQCTIVHIAMHYNSDVSRNDRNQNKNRTLEQFEPIDLDG